MENEIWKTVPGLDEYIMVSNMGHVYFLDKWYINRWGTKTLVPGYVPNIRITQDGYLTCAIKLNGKSRTLQVHRLVAKAFVENPNNLPCVNHINEDKTDNRPENLEWCDISYNNAYGMRAKKAGDTMRGRKFTADHRKKLSEVKKGIFPAGGTPFPKKPVAQYNEDGKLVATYPSVLEAASGTGVGFTCISKCALGNQKATISKDSETGKTLRYTWRYI